MALSDFTPHRVTIEHRGQPLLQVRGLGFDDISVLFRAHLNSIQVMFSSFQDRNGLGSDLFFMELITEAPSLAFDVIAMAADEPDYSAAARKLPAGLQIQILQTITQLTLEDIGGPKGLVALVKSVSQRLLPNVSLTPPSSTASNASS
jgi:hypothetical protein